MLGLLLDGEYFEVDKHTAVGKACTAGQQIVALIKVDALAEEVIPSGILGIFLQGRLAVLKT